MGLRGRNFCEFEVRNARVGRRTDLDRLDFDIKTNGNITSEEALRFAATKIQNQLEPTISKETIQ